MAKQQSKRRRKRYKPGSAYAGDVRPTGVLGFIGSARTMRLVFIVMALALAAGGLAGVFGSGLLSSDSTANDDFVIQNGDEPGATAPPEADATNEPQYTAPPPMTIETGREYLATITTDVGEIQVRLLADQAPETVNNFAFLAQDGFYEGLTFHLVEPGFSAQAGDPTCTADASTCRHDGGPGYDLAEEASGSFEKGTLGMVNGSQFFIALSESEAAAQEYEPYTPFGQITAGLDVAEQLTNGTEIQSIEIEEL